MPVCVLVIDDNAEELKKDFEATISKSDVEFIYESDPVRSIKEFTFLNGSLKNKEVDLILLDINFHLRKNREEINNFFGIGGSEVEISTLGIILLQRLREIDPDIPIGMITAYKRIETAFEAGAGKAQFFWPKPEDEFTDEDGKKLLNRINQTITETYYRYDKEQQKLANKVADSYIKKEASKPGTVIYWIYEEELLAALVNNMVANGKINILDVGCGEGRYERRILNDHEKDVTITGLDFSGRMLYECQQSLQKEFDNGSLKLERGIAEQLKWEDDKFDVVILGFGFLCYSRIDSVLLEAIRVLKPEGILFISIYNNDALFYDAWPKDRVNEPDIPISGRIDRDEGFLNLAGNQIRIRTYTMDEIRRLLTRHNLEIGFEATFPTIYTTLSTKKLLLTTNDKDDYIDSDIAYNLAGLSKCLYEQDKIISSLLKNSGYYGVFIASNSKSKANLITKMEL